MIKYFARKIQEDLNNYAKSINASREFCILSDAGEMEDVSYNPHEPRSVEDRAQVIYGILDADPSKLAPIPGLSVVTYAGTLEVMVEAKLDRKTPNGEFVKNEKCEFTEVEKIESLLNGYGRSANGHVYEYEYTEKNTFTVTISFSPAVVGDWQVHSGVFGEVVPISMALYLTAVENGVSANDLKLWVDGHPVYYENLVLTRQKTPEQYTFGKGESTKTTVLQHAFGIDFTTPLLHGRLSSAILKETLEGSFNTPHVVTVQVGNEYAKDYLCVFGTNSIVSQPGKNVGATLSFVEAKEAVAAETLDSLGEQWCEIGGVSREDTMTVQGFVSTIDLYGPPLKKGARCAFIAESLSTSKKTLYYGSFLYTDETLSDKVFKADMDVSIRVSYEQ